MATSIRGRSGSRTRSTFGSFVGSSTGSSSNWGSTSGSSSTGKRTGTAGTSPMYKNVTCCFQNKINSFKTLMNQTKGPAKFGRPTPTTLNSFANWINKGAIVQTVSCAQVARWAKTTKKNFNTRNPSPTTCKTVLCAKFGKPAIKAVARTKSGSFMVATSPTVKGRSFTFPH